MQVFGHRDFLLVALLGLHGVWHRYGFLGLVSVALQHLFFVAVQLPYIYVVHRRLRPFPYQSLFLQRATGCEYMIVEMLKHVMDGYGLPEGQAFAAVNWIRNLREFGDGLGDIEATEIGNEKEKLDGDISHENHLLEGFQDGFSEETVQNDGPIIGGATEARFTNNATNEGKTNLKATKEAPSASVGPRGFWLASKSRRHVPHDVVVLYVRGGPGYGSGLGHVYGEYLSILTVNLLEQGFSNPACFVPEFPVEAARFPSQQALLVRCYAYIHSTIDIHCHIVVAGDSTGASLAANLLVALCKPSKLLMEALPEFSSASIKALRRPSAAVLISPVVGVTGKIVNNPSDYITGSVLKRWTAAYAPKNEPIDENTDPLLVSLKKWGLSAPEFGLYLTYGAQETLAPQNEEFVAVLRASGAKVRVSCRPASVHSWPILGFYTERLVDHREASLQEISGVISRMLLWRCPSYYEGQGREPVPILTLDEGHT